MGSECCVKPAVTTCWDFDGSQCPAGYIYQAQAICTSGLCDTDKCCYEVADRNPTCAYDFSFTDLCPENTIGNYKGICDNKKKTRCDDDDAKSQPCCNASHCCFAPAPPTVQCWKYDENSCPKELHGFLLHFACLGHVQSRIVVSQHLHQRWIQKNQL